MTRCGSRSAVKIKDRGRPGSRGQFQLWKMVARRSRKVGWESFLFIGTEQKIMQKFKSDNPEYTEIKTLKEVRVALLQKKYLYLDFRDETRFWIITAGPGEYIVHARTRGMAKKEFKENHPELGVSAINRTNFWCDGSRVYCDFG